MNRVLTIIIFLILTSGISNAEVLSLKEAINIALKDNPRIRAFNWSIEAQKEDIEILKKNYYPKITLEERFSRTNNPTYAFMSKLNQERFTSNDFIIDSLNNPDSINDFQTSLNIEQPLYIPKLNTGIKISKIQLQEKSLRLSRLKEEVIRDVIRAYLGVLTAREYVKVAQKSIEDIKEHKRLAELRYKAGLGLYSDVLRAEVSLKDAEKKLISARNSFDTAKRMLALVLGKTEPVDVLDEDIPLYLKDLNAYLEAGFNRYDLKSLKKSLEMAENVVKLEKSTFIPEIGIGGSYQLNDHNTPLGSEGSSYIVMAFLRWRAIDFTLKHRVNKASLKAKELSENIEGLKNTIHFQINKAYNDVIEMKKNIELYEASVKDAKEALRLVRKRYENSLSPVVDLLDTQVMLDHARAKLVQARNDYRIALIDLYFQSGILAKEIENFLVSRSGK
ncbi:MAG: TolC family protein [Nitrospirae bacterium]|nr:TolC family protein [Nitrospirota bacterium]